MAPETVTTTSPHPTPLRRALPPATLVRLAVAWGVVAVFLFLGSTWLAAPISTVTAVVCFAILFATILYAAFGVVREADHLAHMLGEPYGTLILTLSIVAIEVILIAAVMMGPGEAATIARDSIFAVMMIILNLVTGLCLLFGGLRHGEQEYNSQGAVAYLSMIVLLTGTALALPNTLSTGDGSLRPVQALGLAVITALLYAAFLTLQMRGYRRFFVQPHQGKLSVPLPSQRHTAAENSPEAAGPPLDKTTVAARSFILLALLLPIVILAQDMAILIDLGVAQAGAPVAVGGLIIATIVFTPESITAVRAALANQMQRALNLCLGAFVSTVGLTVPVVLLIGLVTQQTVTLGLNPLDMLLLILTVLLSILSFLGLRTSPVQGVMHLTLFVIYAFLLFVP